MLRASEASAAAMAARSPAPPPPTMMMSWAMASMGRSLRHAGLESARVAGMRTVAISTTYPRHTLRADRVVDSLDEVTVEFIRGLADKP